MEQIELVIRMSREYYALIRSGRFYLCGTRGNGKTITSELMESICNGTPLPKGHGRLIDESKIDWLGSDGGRYTLEERVKNTSETIVEADKEGAEK